MKGGVLAPLTLKRCGGTGTELTDDLQIAALSSPPPVLEHSRTSWRYREYEARRDLAPLATSIMAECAHLHHIDPKILPLLAHNDDELYDFAMEIAVKNRARNIALVTAGRQWGAIAATGTDADKAAHALARQARCDDIKHHPRDLDPSSIRRRLRRKIGQAAIHAAGILKLIGGSRDKKMPAYADGWTLRRDKEKRAASKKFLKSQELRAKFGDEIVTLNLADVAAGKIKCRQSMWYAIIKGIEKRAEKNHQTCALFITATLPPAYHLNPTTDSEPDYSLSPKQAVTDLGEKWHRATMLLNKHKIFPIGVKVIEPHADGCPHIHALIWVPDYEADLVCKIMGMHFPATTDDERKAREKSNYESGPALKIKRIEKTGENSAKSITYIMTYIMKSLSADGAGTIAPVEEGSRALAWASAVGVRKIALIGLKKGTIGRFQEFYKYTKDKEKHPHMEARRIIEAMKAKLWDHVLYLLDAFRDGPTKIKPTMMETLNVWKEKIKKRIGFHDGKTLKQLTKSQRVVWTVSTIQKKLPAIVKQTAKKSKSNATKVSVVFSYPRGRPKRPPLRDHWKEFCDYYGWPA